MEDRQTTAISEEKTRQSAWYAVIPAPVLNDKKLNAQCKLLYARISALVQSYGYCWASNSYFADVFDVAEKTIWQWLKKLSDRRYIVIVRDRKGDGTFIAERKIYLAAAIPLLVLPPQKRSSAKNTSANASEDKCAAQPHSQKAESGEDRAAQPHSQKAESGEDRAVQPHSQKAESGSTFLKIGNRYIDKDNIIINILDDDINTARACAKDIADFETRLNLQNRSAYPDGAVYETVRDNLIALIKRDVIDPDELCAQEIEPIIAALNKSDKIAQIVDMSAYILAALKRNRLRRNEENRRKGQELIKTQKESCLVSIGSDGVREIHCTDEEDVCSRSYTPDELLTEMLSLVEPQVNSLGYDVWIRPLTSVCFLPNSIVLSAGSTASRTEMMTRYGAILQAAYSTACYNLAQRSR